MVKFKIPFGPSSGQRQNSLRTELRASARLNLSGFWLVGSCFLLFSSCSKESDDLPPIPPDLPPAVVQIEEKKEEPPKYTYKFAARRDPFYPLAGLAGVAGEFTNPFADSEINPDQTFFGLELRGIFQDRSGKIGIIRSQEGETYTLKSGKIYDRRNRMISGVSGIFKENSIVLISKNKTRKELPLIKGSGQTGTSATTQSPETASTR